MSMPGSTTYTCPYCRMTNSDDGTPTCPRCGAPVDISLRISNSGWCKQPPIRDMARIRFGRSTCQISGTYVPVAETELHDDDWVYFSHHVLLHAEPRVRLEAMRMKGGWNRVMAGLPLIMMRAQGPGFVAFSADHPGEILALPLQPNQAVDVVEHQFLVATGNVGYQWDKSNIWFTTRSGDGHGMALPGREVYRQVHGPGHARTTSATRAWQLLRARPGPRRADPRPAQRADLEGPVGADVPALRVPARQLLVQLGPLASEVDLADAPGTWPDRDQVSVRAA